MKSVFTVVSTITLSLSLAHAQVTPQTSPMECRPGDAGGDGFGTVVKVFDDSAAASDGTRDLLVGAPGARSVYLVDGAPDGDGDATNDLADVHNRIQRPTRNSFGAAIQPLPDLDGDGYREFAVGAPLADSPMSLGSQAQAGAVEIFSGATCMPLLRFANNAPLVAYGAVSFDHFGVDIALMDSNAPVSTGPWYIAVGAYGGPATAGTVYVHRITRDMGIGAAARFTMQVVRTYAGSALGVSPGGRFGWRVERPDTSRFAGPLISFNVNNDGYTDVLVSAPYDTAPGSGAQVGRVFAMSGDHFSNAVPAAFYGSWGNASNDNFGYDLSGLDDKNGDNILDWVAGAPGVNDPTKTGYIRVCDGKTGLPINSMTTMNPGSQINGKNPGDQFGFAVLGIHDINDWKIPGANIYCDVAVGAPGNGEGYVRVYNGGYFSGGVRTTLSPNFLQREFAGTENGERFGAALASYNAKCNYQPIAANGTQGISLPDLAIGSPEYASGSGKVSVFGLNPLHAGSYGPSDKLYNPNTDQSELLLESSVGAFGVPPMLTGGSQADFKTVTDATQDIWLRVRSRTGCFEGYPVSLLIGWYSEPAGCPANYPFSWYTDGVHVPHGNVPGASTAMPILGQDPFNPFAYLFSPIIPCGGMIDLQVLNIAPQLGNMALRVIVQPFVLRPNGVGIPSLVPFFGNPPHGNMACGMGSFNSLAPLPANYVMSPEWIAGNAHEIRFNQ